MSSNTVDSVPVACLRSMIPVLTLFCTVGCAPLPETTTPLGGNVLILLTDDIGIDKTGVYGEHPSPAATPNIDALAEDGILFRNAYAQPTCSPSRASLLTGRYPTRHGLGRWIYSDGATESLAVDELTIPTMLGFAPDTWSNGAVGKWHMAGFSSLDAPNHPLRAGFDSYQGSLGNPLEAVQDGHTPRSYTNWEKDINGQPEWQTTYMVVDTIDDAIAAVQTLPEPFFLYVATNGAHTPVHTPPDELLNEPLPQDASNGEQFDGMVEVVDTQIGRLLGAIPDDLRARTTVVYTTDNGTEHGNVEEPWDSTRAKQTVYEGGVNVPLIITGPLVAEPGSESEALVSLVDIFPTVAEIAGVDPYTLSVQTGFEVGQAVELDGTSLVPILQDPEARTRDTVFAEQFYPNGDRVQYDWRNRMLRDEDWKLVRNEVEGDDGQNVVTHEFYRMEPDARDEGEDLLAQGELDAQAREAFDRLMAEMDATADALHYGH